MKRSIRELALRICCQIGREYVPCVFYFYYLKYEIGLTQIYQTCP